MLWFGAGYSSVSAAEEEQTSRWQGETPQSGGQETREQTEEWISEILEELHLEEVDRFGLEELPQKMTFSQLVEVLCEEGLHGISGREIAQWVFDLFFYELAASKDYFLQILCFTATFAVLKNILDMKNQYVSQLSFLLIYGTLMAMLMQSFLLIAEVAQDGIGEMTKYLTVLVPVYATTLMISGSAASAGAFYELSFLLMTLMEWTMRILFVPGIHIYLLLNLFDQLFLEEKFSKLAELIESGIRVSLKTGLAFVVGFGCIQSMLTPAKDRLSESLVVRSVSAIPGMGSVLGSTGDILLSCGLLIKNSVGVAALLLLAVICLVPILKVFIFTLLYRGLAAVLQPVADKRLINCIHSTGKAGELYLAMLRNSMLLFFLTVAMVTASTSFIF